MTVIIVLYAAFAGAVMFVASHYLGTGGRIAAWLMVAPPAIFWLVFPGTAEWLMLGRKPPRN